MKRKTMLENNTYSPSHLDLNALCGADAAICFGHADLLRQQLECSVSLEQ